ncbi:hypothetical protein L7F22_037647 [Adiantum nelumboides]|nr:hypothetical protein [Adiantum nelumboides]
MAPRQKAGAKSLGTQSDASPAVKKKKTTIFALSNDSLDAGAKRIKRQRDASPLVRKEKSIFALPSNCLEAYGRVLSYIANGKLYLCSVPELQHVLKANSLQFSDLTKEYMEEHFLMLQKVLFQTQFSSLHSGAMIVAMALENSEAVEDLSALQWHGDTSNSFVTCSGRYSDEMPNPMVSMGGFAEASAAEFSGAEKGLQYFDIAPIKTSLRTCTTDLMPFLVDDCYHPDMSMIETPNTIPSCCQDSTELYMYTPMEMCLPQSQKEGYHISPQTFGQEEELVTQSSMPFLLCDEELSQSSTISSLGEAVPESEGEIVESCPSVNYTGLACTVVSDVGFGPESDGTMQIPEQEEVSHVQVLSLHPSSTVEGPAEPHTPASPIDSTYFTYDAMGIAKVVGGTPGEESNYADMVAVEALQGHLDHSLLTGDELSSIKLLYAASPEGSLPLVAEVVSGFVEVEKESTTGELCHKPGHLQNVEQDSSVVMMPSPQNVFPLLVVPHPPDTPTPLAVSSLSFLDLLAHVSASDPGTLKHQPSLLQHSGSKICAKRLFTEYEADIYAEENDDVLARSPRRKV